VVDGAGEVLDDRSWTPFGVEEGTAQGGLGYTGEWWDAEVSLLYLRARWYDPAAGRFTTKDPWEGNLKRSQSLNRWVYVEGNPVRLVDPSGYNWDKETEDNVRKYKQAFLDSARRHNRIPSMDDNGFAALIASTMATENRMGGVPGMTDEERSRPMQLAENVQASLGCVVSGHITKGVCYHQSLQQLMILLGADQEIDPNLWKPSLCLKYLRNDYPGLLENPWATMPTVGWGNVLLPTGKGLWENEALSPMKTTNMLGMEIEISNPFGPQIVCGHGVCGSYDPTELESYQTMALQLLDPAINIEYIATHLEEGALSRLAIGETPNAFMSAVWHMGALRTIDEVRAAASSRGWHWGNAAYIVDDIPKALNIWGLTTNWQKSATTEEELYLLRLDEILKGAADAN
jgi:RHS repeat-associated protein